MPYNNELHFFRFSTYYGVLIEITKIYKKKYIVRLYRLEEVVVVHCITLHESFITATWLSINLVFSVSIDRRNDLSRFKPGSRDIDAVLDRSLQHATAEDSRSERDTVEW